MSFWGWASEPAHPGPHAVSTTLALQLRASQQPSCGSLQIAQKWRLSWETHGKTLAKYLETLGKKIGLGKTMGKPFEKIGTNWKVKEKIPGKYGEIIGKYWKLENHMENPLETH